MSLFSLPKELRLCLWSLVYWREAPHAVAFTEKPIDKSGPRNAFHICTCPLYSPSSAPLADNICQESRAEVQHQAQKSKQFVVVPFEHHAFEDSNGDPFLFHFDIDILHYWVKDTSLSQTEGCEPLVDVAVEYKIGPVNSSWPDILDWLSQFRNTVMILTLKCGP